MKSSKILRIGILPAIILILMLVFQPSGIVLSSLGAAVLHELGHMLAAAILGIPMRSLDVGMFGASLKVRGSLISYPKEFLLCAAGPAMNFLSAIVVIILSERRGYFTEISEWFASVSLMLGVLNLIPAEGFDGGRMLSVAVTSLFGPRVSAKLLSFSTFMSILLLWMLSVWLLIRFGTSLSLFIFTLSLFYRLFIEKA
ncbi:MAG: site-2 protease family protein [Clostridia bacterium]|nr:site-2 protease family protein [Clostridia bacterium]